MDDYYQANHQRYFADTVRVDPAVFLRPLTRNLQAGASILDIGCGSGRDLLWLANRGFRVTGLERAPGLARLARHHSGCPVIIADFRQFDFSSRCDQAQLLIGSLVHLEKDELEHHLQRFMAGLSPGGLILLTLKQGSGGVRCADDRRFILWQEDELLNMVSSLGLTVLQLTRNVSPLRASDIWLTALLKCRPPEPAPR